MHALVIEQGDHALSRAGRHAQTGTDVHVESGANEPALIVATKRHPVT